jgi:hypothetical protein
MRQSNRGWGKLSNHCCDKLRIGEKRMGSTSVERVAAVSAPGELNPQIIREESMPQFSSCSIVVDWLWNRDCLDTEHRVTMASVMI